MSALRQGTEDESDDFENQRENDEPHFRKRSRSPEREDDKQEEGEVRIYLGSDPSQKGSERMVVRKKLSPNLAPKNQASGQKPPHKQPRIQTRKFEERESRLSERENKVVSSEFRIKDAWEEIRNERDKTRDERDHIKRERDLMRREREDLRKERDSIGLRVEKEKDSLRKMYSILKDHHSETLKLIHDSVFRGYK